MRAVVISRFCETLDQVKVSETPKPAPKPNELLILVLAAGVNFVDTLYARGKHQNNKSLVTPPFVLGLEFAGQVISAPAASPYRPGDEIFGEHTGSFAEHICIAADSPTVRKIPTGWTPSTSAGLAATVPVSYDALARRARIRPGETVLIHAAAGGLGVMAVQVAVALGCKVIATAGSAEKCAYAEKYGAEVCFNYSDDDWPKQVLDATGGNGVDVVYDPVGLVDPSLKCIAHRGRILVIGFAGREGNIERVAMNRILLKQVHIIGYRYGESLRRDPIERERIWAELNPLFEKGKILPAVNKQYEGIESVTAALQDLADRKVLGKAVVNIAKPGNLIGTAMRPRI